MAKKKKNQTNRIAFVGDTHVGSYWGLWHDLPKAKRWNTARYLMQCFEHMIDDIGEVDLLVLTGDIIDGAQRKSASTGVHTASMGEQVDAAIEIFRPLVAKAKKTVRVTGTPYHEDFHGALNAFDAALGVSRTAQILDIDLGGRLLNVAHHPSGGSSLYKGTKLDQQALFARVAAANDKINQPTWIVRGHLHEYAYQEDQKGAVCLCPCFKLQDPHAAKINYWRFQPGLGAVVMERDEAHHLGYSFRLHDYAVPLPISYSVEAL